MRSRPGIILIATLLAGSPLAVDAQDFRGGYDRGGYSVTGYGYADEFIRGTYVGAPLTRVPSPSRLVPAPWSYGTYGIPTVSGTAATPAGQPVVMVINGGSSKSGPPEGGHSGAQIVEVRVPRR